MEDSSLDERLRFDIKFLIWRAEVHELDAQAVEARYQAIREQYLHLAQPEQRQWLEANLDEWHLVLRSLAPPEAQSAAKSPSQPEQKSHVPCGAASGRRS